MKGDRELPGGDEVGDLVYSPDGRRFGYSARHDGKTVVVVDGQERTFDVILGDTLAFATDSTRWSVIAGDLTRERLFFAVDGETRIPLPPDEIYFAASRAAPDLLRLWSQSEANRR